MSLPIIILIIVLLVAFGGGGFYAGGNYGPYYGGGVGIVGLLVIILVVYLLLGAGMMAGWYESLFGNLPLQPVLGQQINPAYSRMPSATAPITDLRGAGPSTWASRPHDQNLQSRNMGGYNKNEVWGGPDYQWRQAHGYNNDLPTTPLPDPGYYPDPSITAHINASTPFSPQQIQSALQLWRTGQ